MTISSTAAKESHFLYSESLYCDQRPTDIHTVLGSCVSVCLYDPYLKIGGMNHYLLPSWKGEGIPTAKFGNIAIEKLIRQMIVLGSDRRHLVAKVFGGASQIGEMGIFNIGKRNVEVAFRMLSENAIPVMASQVGGESGRIVLFDSGTGNALVKMIEPRVMKSTVQVY
jgi:chemotaxis protein CheD